MLYCKAISKNHHYREKVIGDQTLSRMNLSSFDREKNVKKLCQKRYKYIDLYIT